MSPRVNVCYHCGLEFTVLYDRNGKGGGSTRKWCYDCYPADDKAIWSVLMKYNMSRPEWDALFLSQDGLCAIKSCDRRAKVVDHDHSCCSVLPSCGKCNRGLLCVLHNVQLGWIENPEWLIEANMYIEEWSMKG